MGEEITKTILDAITKDRLTSFVIKYDDTDDLPYASSFSAEWDMTPSFSMELEPEESEDPYVILGKKCFYKGKIYKINHYSFENGNYIYGYVGRKEDGLSSDYSTLVQFGQASELKIIGGERIFHWGIKF